MAEPLIRVEGVTKHFPVTRGLLRREVGRVRAVDGVSFDIEPGQTLALVGESGCGKTTVGRLLLRLLEPTSGSIRFEGRELVGLAERDLRSLRRNLQIIFQDPYSSLNPRLRVIDIVGEALLTHGLVKKHHLEAHVKELLAKVGVAPSWLYRYPHEFSGGQRQRIGIARALALDPKLIVCDEAVSALDVSIRAQVINLLVELREELGLAYLFISHDLSIVRFISHRVAVMYLGQVVELSRTEPLFAKPAHPYTRALLAAVPWPDPRRPAAAEEALMGDVPSPSNPPSGCRFHTRCRFVFDRCPKEEPPAFEVDEGRYSKCWHAEDLPRENWFVALERRFREAEAKSPASLEQVDLGAEARSAGPAVEPSAAKVEPADELRLEAAAQTVPEPPPASSGLGGASPILPADHQLRQSDPPWPKPEPKEASVDLEHWTKRAVYLGALLAGGVLTLFGHWFLGPLLALIGFVAMLGPASRLRPLFYAPLGIGLLLAFAASWWVSSLSQRHQARQQYEALERELSAYQAQTGAYPDRLHDLGFRLYSIFPEGEPVDPWGSAWSYAAEPAGSRAPRVPGAGAARGHGQPQPGSRRGFSLGSLGPDKKPGTDDIGDSPRGS